MARRAEANLSRGDGPHIIRDDHDYVQSLEAKLVDPTAQLVRRNDTSHPQTACRRLEMKLRDQALDSVQVLFADIGDYLGTEAFALPKDLTEILTSEDWAKAERFSFRDDRVRALLSRYLLRRKLGERLSRSPGSLLLQTGAQGKPYLVGGEIEFNLSHSGNAIALAVSEDEVGIDIEQQRTFEDAEQLLETHFTRDENRWFRERPYTERTTAFLTLWTRKEALYKARGHGLSLPLNRISAHPDLVSAEGWQIRTLQAPPGHVSALAWRRGSR